MVEVVSNLAIVPWRNPAPVFFLFGIVLAAIAVGLSVTTNYHTSKKDKYDLLVDRISAANSAEGVVIISALTIVFLAAGVGFFIAEKKLPVTILVFSILMLVTLVGQMIAAGKLYTYLRSKSASDIAKDTNTTVYTVIGFSVASVFLSIVLFGLAAYYAKSSRVTVLSALVE